MKEIHTRYISALTQMPILYADEEQMKSDLAQFHDCNTKPELLYTNDVLSLLNSSNEHDVEKAKEMIQIRTDSDFYLQCHIMAYIYDIKIHYLGVQKANKDVFFTP